MCEALSDNRSLEDSWEYFDFQNCIAFFQAWYLSIYLSITKSPCLNIYQITTGPNSTFMEISTVANSGTLPSPKSNPISIQSTPDRPCARIQPINHSLSPFHISTSKYCIQPRDHGSSNLRLHRHFEVELDVCLKYDVHVLAGNFFGFGHSRCEVIGGWMRDGIGCRVAEQGEEAGERLSGDWW